ncbi:hypothetical protein SAMD00019534_104140 [Acytostelium subglobosum LB1]|uniref:hypothetical protein n=1 Tax=Acytostelium subglobosum LB1 TaxID=1410327 RepID=UPI0006451EC7|nr:hypothetical protein SAMD00019534_104140 [Acytostelium subglobosum LB1]GAM27239.1 hypothetical protein SAMD00019534_104140 [Acytostelium subglobosum LB1]|eukprot:XP_012749706.1 hypothetical protein SAMD00019534_104140 [Acytostelium subglobosum LB1]
MMKVFDNHPKHHIVTMVYNFILMQTSQSYLLRVSEFNSIKTLIQSMDQRSYDKSYMLSGLRCLTNLSMKNIISTKIGEYGGIQLLHSIIRGNVHNESIIIECLRILKNMTMDNSTNSNKIIQNGLANTMLRVLITYSQHEIIQQKAHDFILNLFIFSDLLKKAIPMETLQLLKISSRTTNLFPDQYRKLFYMVDNIGNK